MKRIIILFLAFLFVITMLSTCIQEDIITDTDENTASSSENDLLFDTNVSDNELSVSETENDTDINTINTTNYEDTTESDTTTIYETIQTEAQTTQYQSPLVWIPTNGGTKYHIKSTCSKMKEPIQVSKDEAISMGFSACNRCY